MTCQVNPVRAKHVDTSARGKPRSHRSGQRETDLTDQDNRLPCKPDRPVVPRGPRWPGVVFRFNVFRPLTGNGVLLGAPRLWGAGQVPMIGALVVQLRGAASGP